MIARNDLLASGQKTQIIECACGTEHVKVISDYEIFRSDEPAYPRIEQRYYLSFYSYGHVGKRSLWSKLRHCWEILWTGSPYADMVVLEPEEAAKLADFITGSRV